MNYWMELAIAVPFLVVYILLLRWLIPLMLVVMLWPVMLPELFGKHHNHPVVQVLAYVVLVAYYLYITSFL